MNEKKARNKENRPTFPKNRICRHYIMLPVNYSSVKHAREKKKQSLEREKRVLQFSVTFVSLARLSREKNIINGR